MKLATSLVATPGIVALFALLPVGPTVGSSTASAAQAATTLCSWSKPATVTRSKASRFSVAVNARGDEAFA
jgi:hypothetical protein